MRDEEMVRVLLASKRISPNNRLLLADYDKQLRAGFLSNKDRNFVRALYSWHDAQGGEQEDAGRTRGPSADVAREAAAFSTLQALKLRLAEAQRRISALESQHEADLKRIALLEDALHKARHADDAEEKGRFKHAKRSFARLFHPDHLHGSDLERQIRADMFKMFWGELEQIEREG